MFTAAIITVYDNGNIGNKVESTELFVKEVLTKAGYLVHFTSSVPCEAFYIINELKKASDEFDTALIVTIGGTGISKRDVTPEATISVCEKLVPGIPELLRAKYNKMPNRAIYLRAVAGIRKESLIINLSDDPKVTKEALLSVLHSLQEGLRIIRKRYQECGLEL